MDIAPLNRKFVDLYRDRIILISGNGQNVGKTTMGCRLIRHFKDLNHKVYALKVSPHIHSSKSPYTLISNSRFTLSLERNKDTDKDSSRYLNAGADASFFLQVRNEHIREAAEYTFSLIPQDALAVVESGAFRFHFKPQVFLFLQRKNDKINRKKNNELALLADRIVNFDGSQFNFDIEQIAVKDSKIYLC
jgi:hypothetical protein